MPSGVYPRKPKPPDPFKLAKGRTIKKMELSAYRESLVIALDNGDTLIVRPHSEMCHNDRWSAIGVSYKVKKDA